MLVSPFQLVQPTPTRWFYLGQGWDNAHTTGGQHQQDYLWFLCTEYVTHVLKWMSDPTLANKQPILYLTVKVGDDSVPVMDSSGGYVYIKGVDQSALTWRTMEVRSSPRGTKMRTIFSDWECNLQVSTLATCVIFSSWFFWMHSSSCNNSTLIGPSNRKDVFFILFHY